MNQIAYQETVVPIGSLCSSHPVLAYERGLTDGGRHARHNPFLPAEIRGERYQWPGYHKGFVLGKRIEEMKGRMG